MSIPLKKPNRRHSPFLANFILASSIFLVGSEAHSRLPAPDFETKLRFDNSLVYERGGKYQMAKYADWDTDRNGNGRRDDKEHRYKVSNDPDFLRDSGLAADYEKDHANIGHMPVLKKPEPGSFSYASTLAPIYVGPLHYGFQVAKKKDDPDKSNKKTVISAIEITDLSVGEILDATAEVYFNRCSSGDRDGSQGNDAPWSPCWNLGLRHDNGYDYDQINMHAAFFLGDTYDCVTTNCEDANGNTIDAGDPIRISEWHTRDCDRNQHHCGLTLPRLTHAIKHGQERKYLLVVGYAEADDSNKVESYHQVELERRKHATGMSVTRFSSREASSAEPYFEGIVKDDVQESEWSNVQSSSPKYFDIFVEDIHGLKTGDVIIAEGAARFRTKMKKKDCDPLFKDFLVLTKRNSAESIDNPNRDRQYHYEGDFHNKEAWIVSPNNYGNIRSDKSDGALIRKAGQVEIDSTCGSKCTRTLRWVGTRFKTCASDKDKWLTKGTYDGKNESFMSYEVYRN